MVLGSSDTQGQTMASVGETRIASYDQAVSALSAFDNAGDLQGAAYDSGKQYGMNVITPFAQGSYHVYRIGERSCSKATIKISIRGWR